MSYVWITKIINICSTIPWSLAKKDIKDDGSIIHDCRFSSIMHNIWQYGNTGCGIFKGGLKNEKNFGLKIQHLVSALVFGQMPNIFKYSAFGFGRM